MKTTCTIAYEIYMPDFDPGTVITGKCLVTDKNGRSLWVDPDTNTIILVEAVPESET